MTLRTRSSSTDTAPKSAPAAGAATRTPKQDAATSPSSRPRFTAPGDVTSAHERATGAPRVTTPSGTVANSSSLAVRLAQHKKAAPITARADPATSGPAAPDPGAADTVATLGDGMTVVRGKDPGNYYCEHAVFTTTTEAMKPGSSILKNVEGEPLTGFLHNPADQFTDGNTPVTDQAARHVDRRAVVGDAIRGYYEEAKAALASSAPFRMLLTGYDAFGSVVNNPTGDFVVHQENIDAAMQSAFGTTLKTPAGTVKASAGDDTTLEYSIVDNGAPRTIVVDAVRLPVTDAAIDGGPLSLQTLIAKFQPNACLSMGVDAGNSSFQAEWHSDDGGLAMKDGHPVHDDTHAPERNNPDNFSLARAIEIGSAESRLT